MEILQGEIGWDITVNALKDKESIMINSPGGSLFEGLAMYDFVKAHNIEVGVIGLCASAATLPLLASLKRWGTPNSRYLIHNPSFFIPPSQLTASELQRDADELKREQERALDLYANSLSISREEIQSLMDKDTIIDANYALQIGLITEIRELNDMSKENPENTRDVNSLYNKFKMQIMEKSEIKSELSWIKQALDKLAKMLKPVKMLILQDVNGVELDFGSEIETPEQITIGVSATVDGSPAAGEYTMPSGEVYVFESGNLNEIKMPENSENEELKKENEDLKVENELLKEQTENQAQMLKQFENQLKEVTSKLDRITNQFTNDEPKDVLPPKTDEQVTRFSYKRK